MPLTAELKKVRAKETTFESQLSSFSAVEKICCRGDVNGEAAQHLRSYPLLYAKVCFLLLQNG
jgi:hypothetical protein